MPDINEPTEIAQELGEKLKVPNVEFDAWVASMPAKHWSKYDLSACRLGWEAALDAERQKREAAERERDEARNDVADWHRKFNSIKAELIGLRHSIEEKGGDEHSPTQWAYDQACRTIEKHRARAEAAEAEVSRLKAGAVTDWQLIESVPKDGRSIAVWLPATATEQPHAFAPVSICEDGTWWDDSTGDQIEPLAATYWAPIHAPSALSNQAGASK